MVAKKSLFELDFFSQGYSQKLPWLFKNVVDRF